eukprot:maker-scaffold1149_size94623-snap-gene-0.17 protein:Tk12199 transcript:maker-scaffold1149_size94623-snap-gene-0.17-mRNA-1 annotation:"hypothetical protein EAG_02482"
MWSWKWSFTSNSRPQFSQSCGMSSSLSWHTSGSSWTRSQSARVSRTSASEDTSLRSEACSEISESVSMRSWQMRLCWRKSSPQVRQASTPVILDEKSKQTFDWCFPSFFSVGQILARGASTSVLVSALTPQHLPELVEQAQGIGLEVVTPLQNVPPEEAMLVDPVQPESGKTTTQNSSYLQNPSFPSPFADTTRVTYKIQKSAPDVCQLRLDFESFTLRGTGNALEGDGVASTGGICLDTFTVKTNTGTTVPTICGQNTGQHIYVDMGREPADSVELNFNFDGTAATRVWEIKVTQFACNIEGHPSSAGCLQYHTGIAGRFSTFNFIPTNDNHLANQEYSICIRQEEGMCCIEYQACSDDNSFSINGMATDAAIQDTNCLTLDYIGIDVATASCTKDLGSISVSQFCGNKLNINPTGTLNVAVCDCVAPFQVDIFTNDKADGGTGLVTDQNLGQSRGVCLEYRQSPC